MIHTYNNQNFDTLQQARKDIAGEINAVVGYDYNIQNTQNMLAKTTWQHLRDEEIIHIGELLALIMNLDQNAKNLIEKGIKEFDDRLNNRG